LPRSPTTAAPDAGLGAGSPCAGPLRARFALADCIGRMARSEGAALLWSSSSLDMPGEALLLLRRGLAGVFWAEGEGDAGLCWAEPDAAAAAEPQPTELGRCAAGWRARAEWLKPKPAPLAALMPTPQPSTPGWLPGMAPKGTAWWCEAVTAGGACEGDERRWGWEKGDEGRAWTGWWWNELCGNCIALRPGGVSRARGRPTDEDGGEEGGWDDEAATWVVVAEPGGTGGVLLAL